MEQKNDNTIVPNKIVSDEKYCSSCGEIINKQAEICPKCGVRQQINPNNFVPKNIKNKTTAGILAILVGGLGVHKFYLGRVGVGIVYIIFCWTMIPSLIALIEGIIYLTFNGTDEEFTVKYAQ